MPLKTKLQKSDGQINIDKYRVTEHIILQNMFQKSEQKFDVNSWEKRIINIDMRKF